MLGQPSSQARASGFQSQVRYGCQNVRPFIGGNAGRQLDDPTATSAVVATKCRNGKMAVLEKKHVTAGRNMQTQILVKCPSLDFLISNFTHCYITNDLCII